MNTRTPSRSRRPAMAKFRSSNTQPELIVRRLLHAAGFRYRLHVAPLPGKPDIVMSRYRVVVFVNGCFWHGHNCNLFRWPSGDQEYWRAKLERNRARDARSLFQLTRQGWRVLVIWECAIYGAGRLEPEHLLARIRAWLRSEYPYGAIEGFGLPIAGIEQ